MVMMSEIAGYQSNNNPNQVYYDSDKGQYYKLQFNPAFGWNSNYAPERTYIETSPTPANNQNSVISNMLANRIPYQYNAPSISQLFPQMNNGNYFGGLLGSNANQFIASTGGQSSGAGRFL